MKYILLIVLVCAMLSCSKPGSDIINDTTKPVLTIIAPAVISGTYLTGDPLCFKADVIDDHSLNSVTLKLFSERDMNKAVIQYSYPVTDRFIHVEEQIIIPAALSGNCVLQFEATDHNGNRAVSTLNFSAN